MAIIRYQKSSVGRVCDSCAWMLLILLILVLDSETFALAQRGLDAMPSPHPRVDRFLEYYQLKQRSN